MILELDIICGTCHNNGTMERVDITYADSELDSRPSCFEEVESINNQVSGNLIGI